MPLLGDFDPLGFLGVLVGSVPLSVGELNEVLYLYMRTNGSPGILQENYGDTREPSSDSLF